MENILHLVARAQAVDPARNKYRLAELGFFRLVTLTQPDVAQVTHPFPTVS
jgi:hypothetical protein